MKPNESYDMSHISIMVFKESDSGVRQSQSTTDPILIENSEVSDPDISENGSTSQKEENISETDDPVISEVSQAELETPMSSIDDPISETEEPENENEEEIEEIEEIDDKLEDLD